MGTHTRNPQMMNRAEAARRGPNKLATTNLTNTIIDAITGIVPHTSDVDPRDLGQGWSFIGNIVAAGPSGEADFEGPQYWVRPQIIRAGRTADIISLANDNSSFDASAVPLPITNLAELVAGTHELQVGAPVAVFCLYDAGGADARLRYFIFGAGAGGDVGTEIGQVPQMVTPNRKQWQQLEGTPT